MLLHHLASLPSPGQVEPPEHERYRSDLPLPQVFVQLDQDPQVDQLASAVTDMLRQYPYQYQIPGHLLLLHTFSSTLAPEQLVPPVQDRCLLDFPPLQVVLQAVQDPQLDHFTSAATEDRFVMSSHNVYHTRTRVAVAKPCLNSIPGASRPLGTFTLPL